MASRLNRQSHKEELIKILEHIKDMVVVTGSYATGKYTSLSDIDFYVKMLPETEINCESIIREETYTKRLIKYFESIGYEWDSAFIDSFNIQDTYIPLEFSPYYDIDGNYFDIEIFGVKMKASISNHSSDKYRNGEKLKCDEDTMNKKGLEDGKAVL